jgi:hypothetical protein
MISIQNYHHSYFEEVYAPLLYHQRYYVRINYASSPLERVQITRNQNNSLYQPIQSVSDNSDSHYVVGRTN